MAITRRNWMKSAGILGAAVSTPGAFGCSSDDDGGNGGGGGGGGATAAWFAHGVASGDPLADAVIIWTRVSPELVDSPPSGAIEVAWKVASDVNMSSVVAEGTFSTDSARDYTVKVDVTGLNPGTTYYYRFEALGGTSIIGRTKTAPEGDVSHVRFAVCSCSSYAHGYFQAYRHMSEQDVDAVLHLGDYIYEYGSGTYGNTREYEPETEIVTLEDYRTRYKQYRRDPDLQAVHAQHPFIVVWDDHESANNAWKGGAENHDSDEGDWNERKSVAYQAYAEWLPIREQENLKIWRSFKYGNLVDLMMLDTRLWGRDEQLEDAEDPGLADESRTLLGTDQEQWLADQLAQSSATWRVFGQQVMMMHQPGAVVALAGGDSWDGYPPARQRFFDVLSSNSLVNNVVVTGDIHMSWAGDITPDPDNGYDETTGAGSLGVEFICPGIASPGTGINLGFSGNHIRWSETALRGYFVLDITGEGAQADWYHVMEDDNRQTVEAPDNFNIMHAKSFRTAAGEDFAVEQMAPTGARPDVPAPAPVVERPEGFGQA